MEGRRTTSKKDQVDGAAGKVVARSTHYYNIKGTETMTAAEGKLSIIITEKGSFTRGKKIKSEQQQSRKESTSN